MVSEVSTLLPPNASPLAEVLETVMAERLVGLEDPISKLWNVDTCPETLLPWLAWSYSVDVWDPNWRVAIKRGVIRKSVSVHRWKGTRRAVEEALEAIGSAAKIVEWWEPAALPGSLPSTFEIWLDFSSLLELSDDLPGLITDLRRAVDAVKPVSAHYTAHARTKITAPIFGGINMRATGHIKNRPDIPDAPRLTIIPSQGVVSYATGHFKSRTLEAS